ncbi:envelope stress response membrane protein PspB [Sphingomonas koreensis]|jgi:phage shock protein B|uniref:Envelope stress response membrane protein PspB n=1 Tax=Sphingomonas koreensis TaxID=93064 RepID=A0A1L6JCI3_9SPHN|nr:envelope stress response membrane protein PspB [Sphingomonas koreensis]APR53659.1 phage shock protein B [Sphingomonas koreensis]MDC7809599.1 envelope stress response membrane protein PspB [Sphingomonas koreensis]RSU24209.1 envelope stress response membrane protein PspB [Sphingomonas koreensis]RSU25912.1 envelope stress response membrane protein PspB [Sphingomonas koreensis]RSU26034.1 envelope stress response membrane protein PspB [Sphingomonas koreensis]
MEELVAIIAITSAVIGLPWLILHYVTKWKQAKTLTGEDENLLDELHYTARRLEDRLQTVERIIAADNPEFRLRGQDTPPLRELPDYERARRN